MLIHAFLKPNALATVMIVLVAAAASASTAHPLQVPASPATEAPLYGAPVLLGQFIRQCALEPRLSPPGRQLAQPCQAYVIGFLESSGLLDYETKTGPRYCLPVEVPPGELVEILMKAGERKELLEYPVAMVLRGTLESSFPCPPEMKRDN
jgi:hypothetical protein